MAMYYIAKFSVIPFSMNLKIAHTFLPLILSCDIGCFGISKSLIYQFTTSVMEYTAGDFLDPLLPLPELVASWDDTCSGCTHITSKNVTSVFQYIPPPERVRERWN